MLECVSGFDVVEDGCEGFLDLCADGEIPGGLG